MYDPLFQGDRQRALTINRYMQALETGDLEAVAWILDEALQDEALERLIVAVNTGYDERWQRRASHLAEDVASAQPIKRPLATPHESYTERSLSMQRTFRSAQQTGTNRFAQIAAAVFVVLLVGSLLLVLHLARSNQATQTGTASPSIHTGKLLCSVSYSTKATPRFVQPPLDWSARGMIATAYPLKTFSAQTCASQSLVKVPETSLIRSIWSPDGKRLLLLHGDVAEVRDASTGSVIASFDSGFTQAVWASNETRIISTDVNILSHTTESVKVQVWDASTGAFIRTAFAFADGVLIGSAWLSPNGQYLALQKSDHSIEFWNIDTGKLVSTTSASVAGNSQPIAWSPDGASLAVGIGSANWPTVPGVVQIWSTTTGQLTASFQDGDTFEGSIGGLAWSPNGKYLAESSAEIHIWDVATNQLVATFGKITTKTTASSGKATVFSLIASVAWAPDSSKLASVTTSWTYPPAPGSSWQNTLQVWQLF